MELSKYSEKKSWLMLLSGLAVWAIYASMYMYFRKDIGLKHISGALSFIGQVGLDLTAAFPP